MFFRGPREAVNLQTRHTTLAIISTFVELLLQQYVALLYDDTYGSQTLSMDQDVFVKPYMDYPSVALSASPENIRSSQPLLT